MKKQFDRALDKYGNCFKFLSHKFPKLDEIKAGVFVGPESLNKDSEFVETMNPVGERPDSLEYPHVLADFTAGIIKT